jgi:chromosome partitioning protein
LWKQESYSREENDQIELIGILSNKMRNIKLHKQFRESLKEMKGISKYLIPFTIHERAIYTEILVEGAKPKILFDLPSDNIARKEYEEVCNYITNKVFNNE